MSFKVQKGLFYDLLTLLKPLTYMLMKTFDITLPTRDLIYDTFLLILSIIFQYCPMNILQLVDDHSLRFV